METGDTEDTQAAVIYTYLGWLGSVVNDDNTRNVKQNMETFISKSDPTMDIRGNAPGGFRWEPKSMEMMDLLKEITTRKGHPIDPIKYHLHIMKLAVSSMNNEDLPRAIISCLDQENEECKQMARNALIFLPVDAPAIINQLDISQLMTAAAIPGAGRLLRVYYLALKKHVYPVRQSHNNIKRVMRHWARNPDDGERLDPDIARFIKPLVTPPWFAEADKLFGRVEKAYLDYIPEMEDN
jgi:hypothetical protein